MKVREVIGKWLSEHDWGSVEYHTLQADSFLQALKEAGYLVVKCSGNGFELAREDAEWLYPPGEE